MSLYSTKEDQCNYLKSVLEETNSDEGMSSVALWLASALSTDDFRPLDFHENLLHPRQKLLSILKQEEISSKYRHQIQKLVNRVFYLLQDVNDVSSETMNNFYYIATNYPSKGLADSLLRMLRASITSNIEDNVDKLSEVYESLYKDQHLLIEATWHCINAGKSGFAESERQEVISFLDVALQHSRYSVDIFKALANFEPSLALKRLKVLVESLSDYSYTDAYELLVESLANIWINMVQDDKYAIYEAIHVANNKEVLRALLDALSEKFIRIKMNQGPSKKKLFFGLVDKYNLITVPFSYEDNLPYVESELFYELHAEWRRNEVDVKGFDVAFVADSTSLYDLRRSNIKVGEALSSLDRIFSDRLLVA